MKRRRLLRRVLLATVGLTVAVTVAGYAILANIEVDDLRPVLERQVRALTGRDLAITGSITLLPSLSPVISVSDVSYANADWGTWPEMLSLDELELEVALVPLLSGELQVRRLVLVAPTILLETNAEGQGNWVILDDREREEAPSSPGGELSIAPWFNEIEIRDGRAIYRDARSGQETHILLDTLTLSAAHRDAPIAITVSGRYNTAPVSGEGTIASYGDVIGGERIPISLRLATVDSLVQVNGVLSEPRAGEGFDLRVTAEGASLSDLSGLTDLDLPDTGPYTLAAHLEEDAPTIRVTGLALRIGESDLSGTLTLDVESEPVSVSGSLVSQRLRVHDIAPAPDQSGTDSRRLLPDVRLPLDGLDGTDVALTVAIEAVELLSDLILRDVEVQAALNDGRVDIPVMRAGLEGARLLGRATLRAAAPAAPPGLALDVRVLGLDYGHLLATFAGIDDVAGTVDIELKGEGQGSRLRDVAATWNGRFDIVGGEGRVPDDLLTDSAVGLIDVVAGWRSAGADLRLTCVVGRWPIEDGVATADGVLIDTEAVTVSASGTIDLGDETLDLRVSPRAKGTSLMSLAVPVRVSGPLADPRVGPDALGTAVGAARIAGMVINPLATGAAIILDSQLLTDRNPCVAALQGDAAGGGANGAGNPAIDRAAEGLGGAVRETTDDAVPADRRKHPTQPMERR